MPVVLVHGVPETNALWDLLAPLLNGDVVMLGLPGFTNPRPEGFGSTMDDYAEWLKHELAAMDTPVDLVGHDWGGILTTRLVTTQPGLVRSWVSDAVTAGHPGFEWHDFGKLWQTPGEGEKFWDGLRADSAAAAGLLSSLGIPEAQARIFAEALDEEMCDSILKLYRSATNIPGEWGLGDKPTDPGLVIGTDGDPLVSARSSQRGAEQMGVDAAILQGAGHWWPLDSPEQAATVLNRFWKELRGKGA
jgi:pimeloyl-ACP methyl ester carboxylesterase